MLLFHQTYSTNQSVRQSNPLLSSSIRPRWFRIQPSNVIWIPFPEDNLQRGKHRTYVWMEEGEGETRVRVRVRKNAELVERVCNGYDDGDCRLQTAMWWSTMALCCSSLLSPSATTLELFFSVIEKNDLNGAPFRTPVNTSQVRAKHKHLLMDLRIGCNFLLFMMFVVLSWLKMNRLKVSPQEKE
jgi:hypothetical protein